MSVFWELKDDNKTKTCLNISYNGTSSDVSMHPCIELHVDVNNQVWPLVLSVQRKVKCHLRQIKYQTVMSLDNSLCYNASKCDYWLSQQSNGLIMVIQGRRQTWNCPHSGIGARASVWSSLKSQCIVCASEESCWPLSQQFSESTLSFRALLPRLKH